MIYFVNFTLMIGGILLYKSDILRNRMTIYYRTIFNEGFMDGINKYTISEMEYFDYIKYITSGFGYLIVPNFIITSGSSFFKYIVGLFLSGWVVLFWKNIFDILSNSEYLLYDSNTDNESLWKYKHYLYFKNIVIGLTMILASIILMIIYKESYDNFLVLLITVCQLYKLNEEILNLFDIYSKSIDKVLYI